MWITKNIDSINLLIFCELFAFMFRMIWFIIIWGRYFISQPTKLIQTGLRLNTFRTLQNDQAILKIMKWIVDKHLFIVNLYILLFNTFIVNRCSYENYLRVKNVAFPFVLIFFISKSLLIYLFICIIVFLWRQQYHICSNLYLGHNRKRRTKIYVCV